MAKTQVFQLIHKQVYWDKEIRRNLRLIFIVHNKEN